MHKARCRIGYLKSDPAPFCFIIGFPLTFFPKAAIITAVIIMKQEKKQYIIDSIRNFRLPRYQEIPNVGLYLEQTSQYISDCLAPLQETAITSSMISNYVKKGLISNPVKKRYYRDQIAQLLFIMLAKSVVSLDHLYYFIRLQEQTYPTHRAYDYLAEEFENLLPFVFGLRDSVESIGVDSTDEKIMLRNTIITIAHKIYLDKCFEALTEEFKAQ